MKDSFYYYMRVDFKYANSQCTNYLIQCETYILLQFTLIFGLRNTAHHNCRRFYGNIIRKIIYIFSNMIKKVLFLLLSLLCVDSQFSKMHLRARTISDGCWKIDSNNLTEIGMGNCISEVYFVELGVGTPPQKFNFHIDTMRDLIWLPITSGFQINQSQTFQITKNTTNTIYNDKVVSAKLGSEIISLENTTISTRSSIAWTYEMEFILPDVIDGLLGLGFSDTPNFLDNAYQDQQINTPVYALEMKGSDKYSIIYYNDLPDSILDETSFVPVIGQSSWKVKVQGFRIGNLDYSYISSKSMIIDSSTSLFYLNPKLFQKITQQYFPICDVTDSHLFCKCDQSFPTFSLILETVILEVQPRDYIIQTNNKKCSILIGQTLYENSPFLVGSMLMKKYVITFDKSAKKIGFTGERIGVWPAIFYILEYSLIGLTMVLLGFGVYVLWNLRVKHSGKESEKKQKKCKNKGKPLKPQISLTFLEY